MKLICPTTLGERPNFSKEKLLYGEVIVLTEELIGSLNSCLDFTKTKFDWDREGIAKHSEGLY